MENETVRIFTRLNDNFVIAVMPMESTPSDEWITSSISGTSEWIKEQLGVWKGTGIHCVSPMECHIAVADGTVVLDGKTHAKYHVTVMEQLHKGLRPLKEENTNG